MRRAHPIHLLIAMLGVGLCNPMTVRCDDVTARRELQSAITAIGGEQVVASVHALELHAVGHRNMLEQSLRPDGPWWQDYFQLDEVRDFVTQSERVSQRHRGYSSSQWWLQQNGWQAGPNYPTYVVSGGVVATDDHGQYAPLANYYLQGAQEDMAFDPVRLLQTAAAAPDLHRQPDVLFHGFRHTVVAFRWNTYPVRLYLNCYTHLPEMAQWTSPHPYDVFWSVWGDVTTRIVYGMWALEPDGLRYPRQWSIASSGCSERRTSSAPTTCKVTHCAQMAAVRPRHPLGTGPNRLELIPYRTETGERQTLVYFPQHRLLYTSDLFAPDQGDRWFTPEYLLELQQAITREHLSAESVFGMHYDVKTVTAALDGFMVPPKPPAASSSEAFAPQLEPLAFFAGHWTCTGQFAKGGKPISSQENFTAILDGHWLRMRHNDQPPHHFQALELWGYDKGSNQFTAYLFDNFSGIRHFTSSGWLDNRLTWTDAASADGATDRFVFQRNGPRTYQVTYASTSGRDKWSTVDTLLCRAE